MDPTANIRKLGFRKWYERELIKSHAALVTCLLCGLLLAALMEQISLIRFDMASLSMAGVALGAIVLGCLSWRLYITMLERAERYGESSICPKCRTYARFDILATGMDEMPGPAAQAVAPLEAAWLRVQCRTCGNAWRMPE